VSNRHQVLLRLIIPPGQCERKRAAYAVALTSGNSHWELDMKSSFFSSEAKGGITCSLRNKWEGRRCFIGVQRVKTFLSVTRRGDNGAACICLFLTFSSLKFSPTQFDVPVSALRVESIPTQNITWTSMVGFALECAPEWVPGLPAKADGLQENSDIHWQIFLNFLSFPISLSLYKLLNWKNTQTYNSCLLRHTVCGICNVWHLQVELYTPGHIHLCLGKKENYFGNKCW